MKTVFICSPYAPYEGRSREENVAFAEWACRYEIEQGNLPIAPHLYLPRFLDDNNVEDRLLALEIGLELLKKCDAILTFGDYISEGMKHELELAKRKGIPHYRVCAPREKGD